MAALLDGPLVDFFRSVPPFVSLFVALNPICSAIPLQFVFLIMDSFCLEGCKMLFRIGLGILGVLEGELLQQGFLIIMYFSHCLNVSFLLYFFIRLS